MRRALLGLLAMTMGAAVVFAPGAQAKKRLTWWVPADRGWKQMHDRFEKENPGVDVVFVYGEMDKFYTMITAGLMPDIWGPWGTPGIHADVNRNWATDLTPYIKRDGKAMGIDDFFPGVMRQFRVAGKQYSLPVFSYADYFFYNTQLYAQAGLNPPPVDAADKTWNWEKMLLYSRKTSIEDPATGKLQQSGIAFSTGDLSKNYFQMWGAEPYSAETLRSSVPQAVHWDTPEMVNCLTKMWELKWRYNVVGAGFTAGKTAASIEDGYNIRGYMATKKLKWALAPLPWAVTNSGTLWPDGWRISRVCKNKDLAWQLIRLVCSPEGMRVANDPKTGSPGSPMARKSVFYETLGRDVGAVTGMDPADVLKIHEQADAVGVVKYQETVCLHEDMLKYINPELDKLWVNRVAPKAAAANLQRVADKILPVMFGRWIRNIKFTGAGK